MRVASYPRPKAPPNALAVRPRLKFTRTFWDCRLLIGRAGANEKNGALLLLRTECSGIKNSRFFDVADILRGLDNLLV